MARRTTLGEGGVGRGGLRGGPLAGFAGLADEPEEEDAVLVEETPAAVPLPRTGRPAAARPAVPSPSRPVAQGAVLAPVVAPAVVTVGAGTTPGRAYLLRLGTPESRLTMAASMRVLARLAGFPSGLDPLAAPWEQLDYTRAQELRAALVRDYAPRSAQKHLACLRGVLRETWRLGLIDRETLERLIDLAPVKGSRIAKGRALTTVEIGKLLARADARLAALLVLAAFCGLRRSEIAGLSVASYDPLDGGQVAVIGKGNKERRVPLPPGAQPRIESWLALRGPTPGPMFCTANKWGGYNLTIGLTAQAMYRLLASLAAEAGVPAFSPHDLRRTYITTLLSAGADVLQVSQLAGHANVQTTMLYDKRGAESRARAVQVLHVPQKTVATVEEIPDGEGEDGEGEGEDA